jgi:hypothetical protein
VGRYRGTSVGSISVGSSSSRTDIAARSSNLLGRRYVTSLANRPRSSKPFTPAAASESRASCHSSTTRRYCHRTLTRTTGGKSGRCVGVEILHVGATRQSAADARGLNHAPQLMTCKPYDFHVIFCSWTSTGRPSSGPGSTASRPRREPGTSGRAQSLPLSLARWTSCATLLIRQLRRLKLQHCGRFASRAATRFGVSRTPTTRRWQSGSSAVPAGSRHCGGGAVRR